MASTGRTTFLNLDLEVWSKGDLSVLVRALEAKRAHSLYSGRAKRKHLATFELFTQPREPASAIRRFVAMIERLPPAARAAWNRASERNLSIGVQAGTTPHSVELAMGPDVLALAASVRAGVSVVVYAADEQDPRLHRATRSS